MSTTEEKIVYIATHAGENPEKAAMPFVMANAALAMDVKAVIALQGNGVYLALKGYPDTMLPGGGFPPMKKLIQDFLELGGNLLVCVPCIKERHIEEAQLIQGAVLTAGGALTQEILSANASLVY